MSHGNILFAISEHCYLQRLISALTYLAFLSFPCQKPMLRSLWLIPTVGQHPIEPHDNEALLGEMEQVQDSNPLTA